MNADLLNIATLFAFAAISIDLILQIRRVLKRRHSADISLTGEIIRLAALIVIQLKFQAIGDSYLILGQLCTLTLLVIYVILIFRYRKAV